MRIHLGHHFYGAGNLGDDFMLAGFLTALRTLSSRATFTCCVPFPLEPLRQRFPTITWFPSAETTRARCIAECDAWLGLGGSPFQGALSRWFVDHLVCESALCKHAGKPMFFLGVGVQTTTELADPDVRRICAQASAIWTRDISSAERLAALPSPPTVESATDLAHVFFRETPPPPACAGRLTLVANFDFNVWPGQSAFLRATHPGFLHLANLPPIAERVWLAQESRDLPGAERALYAALPPAEQSRWHLTVPDPLLSPALSLASALSHWPSGEWLVTARYHAALAGAWAGSKIVILSTNEKLRAAARELSCPLLPIDADEAAVTRALLSASDSVPASRQPPIAPSRPLPVFVALAPAPATAPALLAAADRAYAACAAFVRAAEAASGTGSRSSPSSAVAPVRPTP